MKLVFAAESHLQTSTTALMIVMYTIVIYYSNSPVRTIKIRKLTEYRIPLVKGKKCDVLTPAFEGFLCVFCGAHPDD